jgi:large subunit ribosomal protein L22
METRAVAKYIRISPRKARLAVDLIRGKDFESATNLLRFTTNGGARVVEKVLASAGANAEKNLHVKPSTMMVDECYVDEGPTLKRFRPRAMGRASKIMKRTSHVTIVLRSTEEEA